MENEMDASATSGGVKNYWLDRKAKRDKETQEMNEKALDVLKEAKIFYEDNYPNSQFEYVYDDEKMELSEPSLEGLERDEALGFRRALDYYRQEKKETPKTGQYVGHALYLCNKQIPDIAYINQVETIKKQKRELDAQLERIRLHALEPPKPQVIKEKVFACQWCGKEFKERSHILEHVRKCTPSEEEREEIKEEKKQQPHFDCQICGVSLPREKMKQHAKDHAERGEVIKELEENQCPGCKKQLKTPGGYGSHIKYCDEFKAWEKR